MLMENSIKQENSKFNKDSEATLGILYIFGQRSRGVLDFRSENRQFAGIEEEENLESRQILAGQLRNNGTQGI